MRLADQPEKGAAPAMAAALTSRRRRLAAPSPSAEDHALEWVRLPDRFLVGNQSANACDLNSLIKV